MGNVLVSQMRRRCTFSAVVLLVVLLASPLSTRPVRASVQRDDGTPTSTVGVTAVPTVEPAARPTPAPPPTPTVTPTLPPTPSRVARERAQSRSTRRARHRRHPGRRRRAPTSTPVVTPRPTPTARPRRRHVRSKREAKATPTITASPTATATATPPISLQAEDSVTPVHCNGQPRPAAARPFLTPPYRGWTSIVSYFDHDMPNFSRDGVVITANGLRATPDGQHQAFDFPAYWNRSIRQFVYYDGHNGYDYNLWYQPVYAAAAGKVIFAGLEYRDAPDHGYGYMVMVNHYHGYITLYGHFSKLLVKRGQRVKRGQELGISGNSGHSSGPHLHFTVFHNCTPTDPYGWSGGGDDPLMTYQNETSTYLWLRPPLALNPLPAWPGLSALPATTIKRLLLLRLPSTRRGTGAFVTALKAESRNLLRAAGRSRGFRVDLLRGDMVVTAPLTATQLYALPRVASIASTDAGDDARLDVLNALARAALVAPHPHMHLGHSTSWTGSLFQWNGRTFLLGKGARGKQVNLRLAGVSMPGSRLIKADPTTGAYAVDLGKLSRGEIRSLTAELKGHTRGKPALEIQPVSVTRSRSAAESSQRKREHSSAGLVATSVLLVVLLILAAVGARVFPLYRGKRG